MPSVNLLAGVVYVLIPIDYDGEVVRAIYEPL